jgi:hypothetical protein
VEWLKWIRLPSLMVFFMSGSLSLFREGYNVYHGTIPPATIFWRCVWVAFILSAVAVWVEDHVIIRGMRKEIDALKLTPARMKITPYELRRLDRQAGQKGCSIFLRAKVELLEPLQVAITAYSMELSFDGAFDNPEIQNDVIDWEINDWSQTPIVRESLRPLPAELNAGVAVEGWAHFTTTRTKHELDRSRARLFVHTNRGSSNAEIPAGEEYWNVSRNLHLLPKL